MRLLSAVVLAAFVSTQTMATESLLLKAREGGSRVEMQPPADSDRGRGAPLDDDFTVALVIFSATAGFLVGWLAGRFANPESGGFYGRRNIDVVCYGGSMVRTYRYGDTYIRGYDCDGW